MTRGFNGKKSLHLLSSLTPPKASRYKPQLTSASLVSKNNSTLVNQSFFSQLKKEEHRIMLKPKRIKFDYIENRTGSLALPYSILELKKQSDLNSLLDLSQDYIKEHASRRVDFLFYTFIAYYGTNMMPIEGHTILQYGRGRTVDGGISLTQACHSSFTPALIDGTILERKGEINILSRTHFLESLGSTVELPPFVNAFDDVLEAICRPRCIELLQAVAAAKLNPVEAIDQFLILMDELLQDFAQQAGAKNYSSLNHPIFSRPINYVSPKLIDLVREGTLGATFLNEEKTVNEEYIHLLLRLTKEEQESCSSNAKKSWQIYNSKFKELQEEILNTKQEPTYSF